MTDSISASELAAFRKWQEANPLAAPGAYWLDVEKYGNAQYDAAILLRVLPCGSTRRVEIKLTGWVQELWDFIPRRGSRPAAGNGGYRFRRIERAAYYASPDYLADEQRIDSKTPAEAMKDERNQHPSDGSKPKRSASRKKKTAAAEGLTAA